mmetsp:Transcript_65362/g.156271  ORF Transcript_65362/g.156271 Transcript_65362/m.156271 type:complete len:426 (-) Transcript_65362:34-1311(-)
MVQVREMHHTRAADTTSGKADPGKHSLSLQALLEQQPSVPSGSTTASEEAFVLEETSSAGRSPMQQPAKRTFQPYHAQSVPRSQDLAKSGKQGAKADVPLTTMMLRNIPNKYTQSSLIQEINEAGFLGTYNFFYLPMDVHNRSNVGYAFINFLTPADAEHFQERFSNHRFSRFSSRKIGSVCAAHVQGLDENLLHLENRAVTQARNDQYRPVVLTPEGRLDFDTALAQAKERAEAKARPGTSTVNPAPASILPSSPGDISEVRQQLDAAILKLLSVSGGEAEPGPAKPMDTAVAKESELASPSPWSKQTTASTHAEDVGIDELLSLHKELGARASEPGKPDLFFPPGLGGPSLEMPAAQSGLPWGGQVKSPARSTSPAYVSLLPEGRWCNLLQPVDDRVSHPSSSLGMTPPLPSPLVSVASPMVQ